MSTLSAKTVFVVGAGFSHHAGLPLTNKFTEAILEAREFGQGPSRITVDFLSKFIHDAFDHSTGASAKRWPDLEDVFTCVDLAANSGHYLGCTFSPADLRTVRRAILARIIRMLDQKYNRARKKKEAEWRKLDDFFARIDSEDVGFISMNWDTVIERKLQLSRSTLLIDYGCDARPASIPDPPNPDDYHHAAKAFAKELKKREIISVVPPKQRVDSETATPVVKIHGSANWLYCDSCRQLYWFHPDQCSRIADQLIGEDDLRRIGRFLGKDKKFKKYFEATIDDLNKRIRAKCPCSGTVPLGTRIATFSYRKALEFPMFQKSWFAAEELLRSADKWVFIGYSLPAADYEFKYLLKRTQLCRRTAPMFAVVSGGNARDVRRTYDNYRKFFGRSIKGSEFFSTGLTADAIRAICP
jgi:hypothetical protein